VPLWAQSGSDVFDYFSDNDATGTVYSVRVRRDWTLSGAIVIPSSYNGRPVTSIMVGAFRYQSGITSITIPNSVTTIGDYAFEGCTGITSITIPASVTSIGIRAFENWTASQSINIQSYAGQAAADTAWANWRVNSNARISYTGTAGAAAGQPATDGLEYQLINNGTAYNVGAPSSRLSGAIVIPSSYNGRPVTSIRDRAFSNQTGITRVTIPDSVTSIGDEAFRGTGLFSITIPAGVTSIGNQAFFGISELTGITFEEGSRLVSIGDYAFAYCTGITNITIPASVRSIGDQAFGRWTDSQSITIQYANRLAADTAWGSANWRSGSSARVNYGGAPSRNVTAPLTWTLASSFLETKDTRYFIDYVTYGNGKFIAVGRGPTLAYSNNGIDWTFLENIPFPAGYKINSVVWGNDKFVAVGGGRIIYSRDGINWTAAANNIFPNTDIYEMSITYGNGIYVAAGALQGTMDINNHRIAYSRDGINWTQGRSPLPDRTRIYSIAYGNGKFIMVGYSQITAGQLASNGRMAVSSDGINWTEAAPPFTGSAIYSVFYAGNGFFYIVGAQVWAYSADGERWLTDYSSGVSNRAMAYGAGRLITGNGNRDGGNNISVLDVDNWVGISSVGEGVETYLRSPLALAYGNGRFVCVVSQRLYYSNNQE